MTLLRSKNGGSGAHEELLGLLAEARRGGLVDEMSMPASACVGIETHTFKKFYIAVKESP